MNPTTQRDFGKESKCAKESMREDINAIFGKVLSTIERSLSVLLELLLVFLGTFRVLGFIPKNKIS